MRNQLIRYGEGVNHCAEVLDLGVSLNLINKAGAWYSKADGERIGQGKPNVVKYLKENPGYAQEIEQQIREQLMPTEVEVDAAESVE